MSKIVAEKWMTGEGEYDGGRLLVRVNIGLKTIAGNHDYPYRIGIAIPFKSFKNDGMPSESENEIFYKIEDTILDYSQKAKQSVVAAIITTNGMREFMMYSTADNAEGLLKILEQNFPDYDFQHYVESDPDWDGYKQWI